jgi:NAD(P)-dependent dehydrogenase (short-subunit alcohol dehydrogenase family)
LCAELANLGYAICLAYRETAEKAGHQSETTNPADLAAFLFPIREFSAAELSSVIVDAAERFGGIDVLAYRRCPRRELSNIDLLLDLDENDWDEAMNNGAKGFFLACKFTLPYLINRPDSAIIVLKEQTPQPSETRLTEYAAMRALDAALEHMSQEASQYEISIIQKETENGREWLPEILSELTKR